DVELTIQPVDNHIELQLLRPMNDHLAALQVVVDPESRVFGHQLSQSQNEFLLVGLGLRLDHDEDDLAVGHSSAGFYHSVRALGRSGNPANRAISLRRVYASTCLSPSRRSRGSNAPQHKTPVTSGGIESSTPQAGFAGIHRTIRPARSASRYRVGNS